MQHLVLLLTVVNKSFSRLVVDITGRVIYARGENTMNLLRPVLQ
jgi:hypothetical protein